MVLWKKNFWGKWKFEIKNFKILWESELKPIWKPSWDKHNQAAEYKYKEVFFYQKTDLLSNQKIVDFYQVKIEHRLDFPKNSWLVISKKINKITIVSAVTAKMASVYLKSFIFESTFIDKQFFVTDEILTETCLCTPENGSKQANTDRTDLN